MSEHEFTKNFKNIEEKELKPKSGGLMLLAVIFMYIVLAARQKIVEGAVSMVKMAIDNKDAQPIVNSGSIY